MPEFLEAFDKPMDVHVVDGEVVVLGPDGVAVSLTPAAATESGQRLIAAAAEVSGNCDPGRGDPDVTAARTIGWLLDRHDRDVLLDRVAPAYPKVVAEHVTLQHRAPAEVPLPAPTGAEVVGVADDGLGVQALVVSIDGTTDRPDGSTYHITWSLAPGRGAKESNAVIAARGWTAWETGVPIRLTPAAFG